MHPTDIAPLTVPGTLESLGRIADYVLSAAAAAQLDRRVAYRLRLAVDEIATNIVIHGYEESGLTGDVVVRASVDQQSLTIALEDTAVPFDPMRQGRPEQIDQPLEERTMGGLGVFLAIRGVDEFRYEHDGVHNRNVFVVRNPTT